MHHGEIANIVWLNKSLVCPEDSNLSINTHNIFKSEWIFVQSNQSTIVDKINARKYDGIIK